ncbi:MAG: sel1 repeat family protein [Roseibium sp.]|uniref:SEL1-like repeat protein n=1 Tax=Roseibium sp. TaxID=1936156 RepID=UPI00262ED761|nr:tetratricopeptide repeat protein [Roseibium sp.]MCV0428667.1 sel1 repeat family protein [Roseibium sp.]
MIAVLNKCFNYSNSREFRGSFEFKLCPRERDTSLIDRYSKRMPGVFFRAFLTLNLAFFGFDVSADENQTSKGDFETCVQSVDPDRVSSSQLATLDLDSIISSCKASFEADPKNMRAAALLARALSIGKRYPESIEFARISAEGGDAVGMNVLGHLFLKGLGVEKDEIEAVHWFTESFNRGNVIATFNLGVLYDRGIGVPEDEFLGVDLLRQAADRGFAPSQRLLGDAYLQGRGVARDNDEAVHWYREAIKRGDARAANKLADLLFYGVMLEKVEKEYFHGVPKAYQNLPEAHRLYRLAAEAGLASGMFGLGLTFASHDLPEHSLEKAVTWYKRAAGSNHSEAMAYLGFAYEDGHGVEQDYAEARQWFERAAQRGSLFGMENFARLVSWGRGGPQDHELAAEWYIRAIEAGVNWIFDDAENWSPETISEVQKQLQNLGLYDGVVDGRHSPEFHNALTLLNQR